MLSVSAGVLQCTIVFCVSTGVCYCVKCISRSAVVCYRALCISRSAAVYYSVMCASESTGAIVTTTIFKSCYMRMCLLEGGSACNRLLSDVFQQSAGLIVGVTCPVMFGVPAGMLECTLWLSIVCCYMYQSECWSGHVRSSCTFQGIYDSTWP